MAASSSALRARRISPLAISAICRSAASSVSSFMKPRPFSASSSARRMAMSECSFVSGSSWKSVERLNKAPFT
ncbi:hypothetical protein D1872_315660 [compost metagenome]